MSTTTTITTNITKLTQQLKFTNSFLKKGSSAPNVPNVQQASNFDAYRLANALRRRNGEFVGRHGDGDGMGMGRIPECLRELGVRINKELRDMVERERVGRGGGKIGRVLVSEIGWQNFTLSNQKQFTTLHNQLQISHLISTSMSHSPAAQKSLKSKLLASIKGLKDQNYHQLNNYNLSKIRSQERMKNLILSNRDKYHRVVKRSVYGNQVGIDVGEWEMLGGGIGALWGILGEVMRTYQYAVRSKIGDVGLAITNASIAMVQDNFRKQLSSSLTNPKQLSDHIRKTYLLTTQTHHYQVDHESTLTWGIPYILYKSGSWLQLNSTLNNLGKIGAQLREQITRFEDSLRALEPTPQYFLEAPINDIFYHQIVAIVKGVSLYDERLCRLGELDLVWLVLKSLKIYYGIDQNKRKCYYDIVEALHNYFLSPQYSKSKKNKQAPLLPFIHFLYLGSYSHIFTYKKLSKRSIQQIDYVHLLLALQSKPQLLNPNPKPNPTPQQQQQQSNLHQSLLQILKTELTTYIANLLQHPQDCQYVIFYLLKIPRQYFREVVANLFSTWELFSRVNRYRTEDGFRGWNFVKFRCQYEASGQEEGQGERNNVFQDCIESLFRNYIQFQQNSDVWMKIIETAEDLFESPEKYFNLIILCQCKHLLRLKEVQRLTLINKSLQGVINQRTDQQNRRISQRLNHKLEQTLNNYQQQNLQFGPVVKFLYNYCELSTLQSNKITKNLQNFLIHDQYKQDLPTLAQKSYQPLQPTQSAQSPTHNYNYMKKLYEKLLANKGTDLLFIYINSLVYAKEKVDYGKGTPDKFVRYRQEVMDSVEVLRAAGVEGVQGGLAVLDFWRGWNR